MSTIHLMQNQNGMLGKLPIASDPYFSDVTLLLRMNGADASTTFTDESSSGRTVTPYSSVELDDAIKKYGDTSGKFYGGYLQTPYVTADFDWWVEDYTLECWVYLNAYGTDTSNGSTKLIGNNDPTGGTDYWTFGVGASGALRLYYWSGVINIHNTSNSVSLSTWTHLALTMASGVCRMFIGGTKGFEYFISNTPQSSPGVKLTIGRNFNQTLNGWIDDLRITKGTARYTTNFTPPEEEFPAQ